MTFSATIDMHDRGSGTDRRSPRAWCSRPCRARSAWSRPPRPRRTGTSTRKSRSVRIASSAENSTSSTMLAAKGDRGRGSPRAPVAGSSAAWLRGGSGWCRGRRGCACAARARAHRGGEDVAARGARQRADRSGPSIARGDLPDRLSVARRGGGEAGLDHVDAERGERLGHAQLAVPASSRSRAPARRRAVSCRRCVTWVMLTVPASRAAMETRLTSTRRPSWRASTCEPPAGVARLDVDGEGARRPHCSRIDRPRTTIAAPFDRGRACGPGRPRLTTKSMCRGARVTSPSPSSARWSCSAAPAARHSRADRCGRAQDRPVGREQAVDRAATSER